MIDYLRQQIAAIDNNNLARCMVREYLQARLLECLQDTGAFETWAFVGGTALRFLYAMPRFSEDLDFSLIRPGADIRFEQYLKKAKSVFEREAYAVSIKAKTEKTVQHAFIKFVGLLFELGLSPHRAETISIKVEMDTNPPAGANVETGVIRRHILLNLLHYDKPSLLAGKLHALLARDYVKGRDVYDLVWYLSDRTWPEPNITLLNNALRQTGWQEPAMTPKNWRRYLVSRVQQLDWKKVADDVRPFLARQQDLNLLDEHIILKLLEST